MTNVLVNMCPTKILVKFDQYFGQFWPICWLYWLKFWLILNISFGQTHINLYIGHFDQSFLRVHFQSCVMYKSHRMLKQTRFRSFTTISLMTKCIFGETSLWASLGVTRYLMFLLHYFNLPLEHLPLPLSIVSLHGVKYIVLSCCHFSFGRNWKINNGRNWNTLSIHGIQKRGHLRGLYGTMRM